ncbi:MAG: type III PLP-dependent enzyme [Rhodobacteraceae bacterium]|nr:type III PLP-dependent enzyme [Paracoccaceae bacterium]
MDLTRTLWQHPRAYLAAEQPEDPVLFFAPAALRTRARLFLDGFPGLVTYAVKANPEGAVLDNLAAEGLRAFDVASPAEIALVHGRVPGAAMHYNNPVRSRAEIAFGRAMGVASWSVDRAGELAKLREALDPGRAEIAVRFKLPVKGAAYDFGAKFGAEPARAAALLAEVAQAGFVPSLTFHPGTQCADPAPWVAYVAEAASIARSAGVEVARLNVGGGFPSARGGAEPDLAGLFETIARAVRSGFGASAPALVCEPGRGLVADAFAHAARVKGVGEDGALFLNDGIYGAFAEMPILGLVGGVQALDPEGRKIKGVPEGRKIKAVPEGDAAALVPRVIFGPTCDSLDVLPGPLMLPRAVGEGCYLLTPGMGAYSTVTATSFNGFGTLRQITVERLDG